MLKAVSAVTTLTNGTSTIEVVTDGAVGSQKDATIVAESLIGQDPELMHRTSQWGDLTFYFRTTHKGDTTS